MPDASNHDSWRSAISSLGVYRRVQEKGIIWIFGRVKKVEPGGAGGATSRRAVEEKRRTNILLLT